VPAAEETQGLEVRRGRIPSPIAKGIAFALGVYVTSRLLGLFSVYIGTRIFRSWSIGDSIGTWDSYWYLRLAEHGYPHVAVVEGVTGDPAQNTIAFFPLYPMIVRGVEFLTPLSMYQSALTVSMLSGATACVLLWFLANHLTNEKTANRAVALFAFFPGSIAVSMLMADGLMISLIIACTLAMLQKRWLLAGTLAAFATATRPTAMVLVVCCAFVAVHAVYKHREWRALVMPLLAPLGMLAYFTFLWHHTGDFWAWHHVEEAGWNYGELGYFQPIRELHHPFKYHDNVMSAITFGFTMIGLYALVYWRPPVVMVIYVIGLALLAFGTGHTHAKPRYMWAAFPMFIAFARAATHEFVYTILLTTLTSIFSVYFVLTLFNEIAIP
jgi:hypothetical protein